MIPSATPQLVRSVLALTVTRGDSTETKIENNDWVGRVAKLLQPHFPELRTK